MGRVHYLTDHYEFHSWYDDPKTDARTWGLDHPDNRFSFFDALAYYKASLEVPEEEKFQGPSIKGDHFKLNIDITPKDAQDQRQIYLAFAYRSLREKH